MAFRIIPRLDIKGPNLVKGVHLEGLRVLGKPEAFARHYYEQGADELLYVDVVASLYGRNSLLDLVQRTAEELFVPFCVGGGLRSIEDVRHVLRAGADKVLLNTAAIKDPQLVRRIAEMFGSSTIVIAIEAIKQPNGRYECFTDSGRESTGVDAFEWAQQIEELGAGELFITSVDREGTGKGFDIELIGSISRAVGIPVIAHGGAGSAEHLVEVLGSGGADAVSIASMLHYETIGSMEFDESAFVAEGNVEFRKQRTRYSTKVNPVSLTELKLRLEAEGLDVRVPGDP